MIETAKLIDTVKYLQSLHREGGYWDFKEQYDEDKGELLLDIICMANNQENRDAYLIYGIDDKDYLIRGVENDPRRWKLSDLSQFIHSNKFAVYSPEIDLQTIRIDNHDIDVIIISNSNHTPYYLEKPFQKVKAGVIYLRLNDRKAGVDIPAPFSCIEHLWRKRFGIDNPPFERFNLLLLETENWSEANWDLVRHSYHRIHPEFQIVVGKSQEGYENLRYFYDNERMFYAPLKLQYLSTTLHETNMYYMDEGRCIFPMPSRKVIFSKYLYYYFRLDTIEGHLFHRITSGKCVCNDRAGLSVPILVFKNESEEQAFQAYMDNEEIIEAARKRLNDSAIFQHIKAKEQRDGIPAIGNVTSVAICFEAYKKWREDYAD